MWMRDLVNEGIDPDDYVDPSKDEEIYTCPGCGQQWAVQGWFPPDYPDNDGGFADMFCVEYGEDLFCEWCAEQGEIIQIERW